MRQIIKTKLFRPRLPIHLVSRPHLFARLNAGISRKLTLLSAPAGFGKSTLTAQWLSQLPTDTQVGWYSLAEDDDQPVTFFTYLLAMCAPFLPELEGKIMPALNTNAPIPARHLITQFINELAELPHQLVLVFDDFHLITNATIHEAITFLLAHCPPHLHLVLTSRADPPFPLARWRARHEMTEVRATALRFSLGETSHYLNQLLGLALADADLEMLDKRTEGWVASLQLMALAMQQGKMPANSRHQFIQDFAGSDRYLFDYLVEEVLAQQSPAITQFLLQTAILDRLCAPLCDAICDTPEASQAILEHLETTNLFLFPLDNQRQWYRYHHLFADVLRARLHYEMGEEMPALHRRASRWYAEQGDAEQAIHHALIAQDFLFAAEKIESVAHAIFGQGRMAIVIQWFAQLPPHFTQTRPDLFLLQGWLYQRMGEYEKYKAHLQTPFALNPDSFSTDLQKATLLILRTFVYLNEGEFQRGVAVSEEALQLLPAEALYLKMPAISIKGWCLKEMGDLDGAIACHQASSQMAPQAQTISGSIVSLGQLVNLYAEKGAQQPAAEAYEQVVALAEANNSWHLPLLGLAYIGKGRLLSQQNDPESAIKMLRQGLDLAGQWGGLIVETMRGYDLLIRIFQAQGDTQQAQAAFAQAHQLGKANHAPAWSLPTLNPPSPTKTINTLTRREQDVLQLLADGLTSPEIAGKLVVSVSTIRTHIKRIYSKLNAHSRHEAIQQARKQGLL